MGNKRTVIIGVGVLIIFLIFVAVLLLVLIGRDDANGGGEQVFPETEEFYDYDERAAFLFGTSSERFVATSDTRQDAPVFRAVTTKPVGAAMVYLHSEVVGSSTVTEPIVRYVTREDGHLYDTSLEVIEDPLQLTGQTILRVVQAQIAPTGMSALMQYSNDSGDIVSYLGTLEPFSGSSSERVSPYKIDGITLGTNVSSAAFSNTGRSLAYVRRTELGSEVVVQRLTNGERLVVWESMLRNITVRWTPEGKLLVYSNPSSIAAGYMILVDPATGSEDILFSAGFSRAASADPSSNYLLYSEQEEGNEIISLYIKDRETGDVVVLPSRSLVEKCAWGPAESEYLYCAIPREELAGEDLERWYMGMLQTDDVLWRFNKNTLEAEELFDPVKEAEEVFDIVDIALAPDESYMVFRTRVNNVLWALELPQQEEAELPMAEEE